MTDQEKIAKAALVIAIHNQNVDDDEGDKYLSDKQLAFEAVESIIVYGDDSQARRDGFLS